MINYKCIFLLNFALDISVIYTHGVFISYGVYQFLVLLSDSEFPYILSHVQWNNALFRGTLTGCVNSVYMMLHL